MPYEQMQRMKRAGFQISFLFLLILAGCTVMAPLQKRRLITVFHLIETAKYADAKVLVEEMITEPVAAQWPRLWYARGLLCQTAYTEGIQKKDKKLFELYPDQLFVAYDSYERALSLDRSQKTSRLLTERYIRLVNDFQRLGEQHFNARRYPEALKAYEYALRVNLSPVLAVRIDTGIIYNAGLSAFEAGDTEKAVRYLGRLHDHKHSPNVTHLLYLTHLSRGDTLAAGRTLAQGVVRYSYPDTLVMLYVDLLQKAGLTDSALRVLDLAIEYTPNSFSFHYTKGLVLQKAGKYPKAIEVYKKAHEINTNDPWVTLNIATCYYNLGIGIEEQTRLLTVRSAVVIEREKSAQAFADARHWIQRTWSLKPSDPQLLNRLSRLTDTL